MRNSCVMACPLGRLRIEADEAGICAITLTQEAIALPDTRLLEEAERQLHAYFDGTRRNFDLPLHQTGTAFQLRCWQALASVPYGQTISYGEQARRIGQPKAVRAVGGANHRNPIIIVVPCHRVIGADGRLTGYGGGLDVKAWLLAHEAKYAVDRR